MGLNDLMRQAEIEAARPECVAGIESPPAVHPGRILAEEFLAPRGISRYRLAKETYVDITRLSHIIRGTRNITADAALRLSRFFGTPAEFWMELQVRYDLQLKRRELSDVLELIKTGGRGITHPQ